MSHSSPCFNFRTAPGRINLPQVIISRHRDRSGWGVLCLARPCLVGRRLTFYRPARFSRYRMTSRRGMVFGMATTKITVTLPDEQLREIRVLIAASQTTSVSAFVKHAVGIALFDAAGWREMLRDALQETGGPLTAKDRAWADGILSPRPRKSGAKKRKAA